jgi:hypothetical protein
MILMVIKKIDLTVSCFAAVHMVTDSSSYQQASNFFLFVHVQMWTC